MNYGQVYAIQERRKRTMKYARYSNDFLFKMTDEKLKASSTQVMLYLLLRADVRTGNCYQVKRSEIAADCRLHRDTVRRALGELEERGFIDIEAGIQIVDMESINKCVDDASYKAKLKKRRASAGTKRTNDVAGILNV